MVKRARLFQVCLQNFISLCRLPRFFLTFVYCIQVFFCSISFCHKLVLDGFDQHFQATDHCSKQRRRLNINLALPCCTLARFKLMNVSFYEHSCRPQEIAAKLEPESEFLDHRFRARCGCGDLISVQNLIKSPYRELREKQNYFFVVSFCWD